MTTRQQNQRLSEIAVKPIFRRIDGVSIRFAESATASTHALLLTREDTADDYAARVTAWWAGGYKARAKSSTAFVAT